MIKAEIFVFMILFLTLSNTSVYGMYDAKGNWVCSDVEIELSYYEFYTEQMQSMMDDIYNKE